MRSWRCSVRRRGGRRSESSAGRPVRVRNTSSSVGRRRPTSSIVESAVGERRGRRRRGASVPRSTATVTRRSARRRAARSSPSGASSLGGAGRGRRRGGRGSRPRRGPAWPFSSSGVPVAIARPWSTITTWSASWSASSRYCVVSSTSVPAATSDADRVPQLDAAARVEAGRRLVEQQQAGRADEAGAEVEAAAHAARVAAHEAVGRVVEAELVEHGVGGRPGGPAVVPEQAGDHHEVLAAGQRRLDRGGLAGQPDRPATCCGSATASMPATRRCRRRAGAAWRRPHERGLAGAVRAEHGGDLPGRGDEVEPVEGDDRRRTCPAPEVPNALDERRSARWSAVGRWSSCDHLPHGSGHL